MKFFSTKLFRIEKGEGLLLSLLIAYLFFLISSLLILKPVSNSLFIQNIGIQYLPIGFMIVAGLSGLLMAFYLPLTTKYDFNKLITGTLLVSICCLIGFWFLFSDNNCAFITYFIFYVWVSIYGVITASQFWLLSGRALNSRQGKRLFGLIGAGGIAGGIFGGYLTSLLADSTGTRNLLFLSMLFLAICILLGQKIGSIYKREKAKDPSRKKNTDSGLTLNPFKILSQSPHILNISVIVFLAVMAATMGDYVFRSIAAESLTNEDKLTSFFGFWQSNLSIIALIIQLLITSRLISRIGVTGSLSVLPLGILMGAVLVIFNPGIFSAVILKVSDGAFKQSIYKSGMEMLYFPISSSIKKRIKGFIDVFLDNFATGVAGLILLVILNNTHWKASHISIIIVITTFFWLIYLMLIKKSYLLSFRSAIEKRTIDFDDPNASHDIKDFLNYLSEAVESGYTKRILYMLDLIEDYQHPNFIPLIAKLLRYPSINVKKKALLISRGLSGNKFESELSSIVLEGPQEIRIEAMHNILIQQKDKIHYIKDSLSSKIKEIQWGALICAARECRDNEDLGEFLILDPQVRKFTNIHDEIMETEEENYFRKVSLGQMVGESKLTALFPILEDLLQDSNPKIVKSVIPFAGKTSASHFCYKLINMLENPRYTTLAKKALVKIGESICDHIDDFLKNNKTSEKIRIQLPKVLSYLTIQKSVDILERHIENSSANFFGEAVKSLGKLKNKNPDLEIDRRVIFSHVMNLLEEWYVNFFIINQLLNFKNDAVDKTPKISSAYSLLERSLREKNDTLFELVFRLLGMRYVQIDLRNAYLGVTSDSKRLKANAIEYLDNLLDNKLKNLLIPIIENKSTSSLLKKSQELGIYSVSQLSECLKFLTKINDSWIASCSLYLIALIKIPLETNELDFYKNNKNYLISETAGHL